ncbi:MAG: spermidine synthase [Planctomycetaceae bacterium]|nr:spermidine synthase [Planctomycetaceae bacterium]
MRFPLTIFLSAFLLFQVQPLMGRYVLPWFGGTPAVWTTCMLLFQMLLLAGYAYAHAVATWFTPRTGSLIHLVLLFASLAFLPVIPHESWKPHGAESPVLHILGLLAATTGMPYLMLSSTGPLLQSWFSRAYPGHSPYRLYALSNVGSLLALVTYPLVVEPSFALRHQAEGWSVGFALFVLSCAWTAWTIFRAPAPAEESSTTATARSVDNSPPPTWLDIFFWLAAAACGSMLLLATTNQMCQEVAVVPFLWVLPLALYLITFIIAFDKEDWYHRAVFGVIWGLGAAAAVYVLFGGPKLAMWQQIGGLSLALFGGCMICHGELVRFKPAAKHLTLFYLMISAGGALGGLLVAVVAPNIFSGYWEIHVALELTSMLACWAWFRDRRSILYAGQPWWGWAPLASLLIVQQAFLSRNMLESNEDVVARTRNFYGVLRVKEYPMYDGTDLVPFRSLVHGNILHGVQFVDGPLKAEATSYYGHDSGVGVAVLNHPKRRQKPYPGIHLGVVGLGTGSAAVYGLEHDTVTYYEINPEVVRLADEWFTYRKPSQSKAAHHLVLGDARIQMERQLADGKPQGFDVLVVDAFSSDAIPMHLLTVESVELYKKHMAPGGIICLHLSNNHLNLIPIARGIAKAVNLEALWIYGDQPADEENYHQLSSCSWVVMTDNQEFLHDPLVEIERSEWDEEDPPPLVWTDDYGALRQVIKLK